MEVSDTAPEFLANLDLPLLSQEPLHAWQMSLEDVQSSG